MKVINFESCDRTLKWEFAYWGGTLNRWYNEGLTKTKGSFREYSYGDCVLGPGCLGNNSLNYNIKFWTRDLDVHRYFNFDEGITQLSYFYWIYPHFEKKIIFEDNNYIELIDCDGIRKKILKDMAKKGVEKHVFGMYLGKNRYYLLTLKDEKFVEEMVEEEKPKAWKNLDVTVLHYAIFDRIMGIANQTGEKVTYTNKDEEAVKLVDEKGSQVAFFLNPTKIEDVTAIASKLEKMPQKSTFFFPKLLSGLALNKIVHGEKIKL